MIKERSKKLGMNARSIFYLRENKKSARKIADNKILSKRRLVENGISAADPIAVITNRSEVQEFDWNTLPASFVIKPNRGMGGEGIMIVFNRLKNGNWITVNKQQLTAEDLALHVLNILDGNFSLLNSPDVALIESRLSIEPLFKRFSSFGIPDIRVIVYNNVPVMAMLRVPTVKSRGKANLMQGGLGIGIDIASGFTTHVVTKSWLYEKEIDRHPDTNLPLRGIKVPYWEEILKTAVLAAFVTRLRYTGVDISVDKKKGPVVLELNARPGLGIQVANMLPLRERLQRIRGLKVETPERGIAIAKDLFSGQFEAAVANITGRQVIGLVEVVTLHGTEEKIKKVRAKIDTGADDSSIDIALAREMGYGEAIDYFQSQQISEVSTDEEAKMMISTVEKKMKTACPSITRLSIVSSSHGISIRPHIKMHITLVGHKMIIEPNIYDRSQLTYPLLIGRRNLSHFLIDPAKATIKQQLLDKKRVERDAERAARASGIK